MLLPTRNGGPLLETCIRSVLDEGFEDMELVVADNANTDETADVLERFAPDPRLKTLRHDMPLPVVENWTSTLAASSGNYVLQIGDDDLLLPGYFDYFDAKLREFGDPDCLTCNGYSFIAPDVLGEGAPAQYREWHFQAGQDLGEGLIPSQQRARMLRNMFRDLTFDFGLPNSFQMTVVSRSAIDRLRNGLFQPPFPDLYALGALLLVAESWAYVPQRRVVIGVSPKSYGRFFHAGRHDDAFRYLGVEASFESRLPGNETVNGCAATLWRLKHDYPRELEHLNLNRGHYVLRQVWAWYRQGGVVTGDFARRLRLLRPGDWIRLLVAAAHPRNVRLGLNAAKVYWRIKKTPSGFIALPGVSDIGEFAERVAGPSDITVGED